MIKKLLTMIGVIALIITTMTTGGSNAFAKKSPYDSGFDHGCDDAKISNPADRYINQYEKGPAYHTTAFMNGYDRGFIDCSQHSGNNNDRGYYEVNTAIDDSNFDDHSVSQPQNQQAYTNQVAGCPKQIINGDCILNQDQNVDNTFGQANRND